MKALNTILIISICCFLAFFSMFFSLGSHEDKNLLKINLPLSYLYRSLAFSILGLVAISILILLNFAVNKSKIVNQIDLKLLSFRGAIIIIITSFLSSIFFFLN